MRAAHAHRAVAEVAKAAAAELYGELMRDNRLYEVWRVANPGLDSRALERQFVAKNWDRCLPLARATMALMLRHGRPDAIDAPARDAIMEALVLDSQLLRGRQQAHRIIGAANK